MLRTNRITMRVLAGATLAAGLLGGRASAQGVKAEDVLARKPAMPGVAVGTPTGADLAGCKAEQVTWPAGGTGKAPTGVVVKDGQGRLVRQFIDTTGTGKPNIWSFYQAGTEVYREVDGNGNGKPDQFRWLGANGAKWGVDFNEDGAIDAWASLSPEELSQELFQAILARDSRRLEALLPSEQDLKGLGLPDAEVGKVRQRAAGAVKKMVETADALKLGPDAKWIHLELGTPTATPADAFGGREDLVKHRNATVLVEKGDGKSAEAFQTGELMLVNRAWKLVDGPAPGAAGPQTQAGDGDAQNITVPADAQKWVDALSKVKVPDGPAEMPRYHMARAGILTEIVRVTKGAQQEPWLEQVIDALASAAEAGDPAGMQQLKQWQSQIEGAAPKAPAAAAAAFRVLTAENALATAKLAAKTDVKPDEYEKAAAQWRDQLEGFVQKYPQAKDAPEAINRLAMAYEAAKDGDAKAKGWYERLAKDFAGHPYAAKAQGAVRRLGSEGQPFVLSGQTLNGQPFSAAQLNGKVVVVHYWATWNRDAGADLKQLADLAKQYGPKGLEVVTVNLDDAPAKAVQALTAVNLPGTHLYLPGGVDGSPLAVAYGIQMVPHGFVVGKDGKVTSRNAQVGGNLKDEVEKLVK